MEPSATRRAKEERIEKLALNNNDVWVDGILPFLGPGHFLYVVLVFKRFKGLYLAFAHTIKDPPMVWEDYEDENSGKKIQAAATSTFYSSAFSSVPCAKHWDKITKDENNRLRDDLVCETVAMYGNLEVLKWAHRQGFPWDDYTCAVAADEGHLEVLKYAHENGCEWDRYTCAYAAEGGHLEVLKYAHEKGCDWNEWTCAFAAKNGYLEVLKYVLKYAHENGCPWNERTCFEAAFSGHLEVLKYAHEQGCPWDERTCTLASANGHRQVAQWAHDHGCPRP